MAVKIAEGGVKKVSLLSLLISLPPAHHLPFATILPQTKKACDKNTLKVIFVIDLWVDFLHTFLTFCTLPLPFEYFLNIFETFLVFLAYFFKLLHTSLIFQKKLFK